MSHVEVFMSKYEVDASAYSKQAIVDRLKSARAEFDASLTAFKSAKARWEAARIAYENATNDLAEFVHNGGLDV